MEYVFVRVGIDGSLSLNHLQKEYFPLVSFIQWMYIIDFPNFLHNDWYHPWGTTLLKQDFTDQLIQLSTSIKLHPFQQNFSSANILQDSLFVNSIQKLVALCYPPTLPLNASRVCNGTRIVVKQIMNHDIATQIITGHVKNGTIFFSENPNTFIMATKHG